MNEIEACEYRRCTRIEHQRIVLKSSSCIFLESNDGFGHIQNKASYFEAIVYCLASCSTIDLNVFIRARSDWLGSCRCCVYG